MAPREEDPIATGAWRITHQRGLVVALVGATLVSGCGGTAAAPTAGGLQAEAPSGRAASLLLVNSEVVVGPNRLPLGLLSDEQAAELVVRAHELRFGADG